MTKQVLTLVCALALLWPIRSSSPILSWSKRLTTTPTKQPKQIGCRQRDRLTQTEFESVMREVQDGWNEGNPSRAARCFAEEAIYSAPPSSGHRGRKDLYEYFGGEKGRELPMRMTWHHLVFDPSQQVGVGEYTFRYRIQTHGMVIVKFSSGLITNWREYEVESNLGWDEFVGANKF